ncbi:AAA family ATPase [Amycolatopsis sp. NBC_01480]|uniref:AAA family ATPase n=1 Tax=Amycolatopsis sp. NBC_01480 TaxID=2903562 RepID=UPI002E2999B8|nr:AAA family ATPase [Amycolatopsis sp. NBC_01480]
MLFTAIDALSENDDVSSWPFTVSAIRQVAQKGLQFSSPITVIVGANGSGKSTLVEAIAESYGLDVRGGHGARKYGSSLTKGPLGEVLRLKRTTTGQRFTRAHAKGFFLRAETAFGMLSYMTEMGVRGYGERLSTEVSHGESYLQAILGRFDGPGLYLLDEAEGPLSVESTLALMYRLREIAKNPDVQIIYATHSPLISAIPGAQILQMTEDGIAEVAWNELELVGLHRRFLENPRGFFED